LDFESACLAKGGRFGYDWVNDPKGGCMSVKGDFKFRALGYVYFKQWYTGLKCRALESKAYFYKSNGGIMVMADKKDVQFDWEGGLL
jgi:hypothetical protein